MAGAGVASSEASTSPPQAPSTPRGGGDGAKVLDGPAHAAVSKSACLTPDGLSTPGGRGRPEEGMRVIRVAVADDDPLFREALVEVIRSDDAVRTGRHRFRRRGDRAHRPRRRTRPGASSTCTCPAAGSEAAEAIRDAFERAEGPVVVAVSAQTGAPPCSRCCGPARSATSPRASSGPTCPTSSSGAPRATWSWPLPAPGRALRRLAEALSHRGAGRWRTTSRTASDPGQRGDRGRAGRWGAKGTGLRATDPRRPAPRPR